MSVKTLSRSDIEIFYVDTLESVYINSKNSYFRNINRMISIYKLYTVKKDKAIDRVGNGQIRLDSGVFSFQSKHPNQYPDFKETIDIYRKLEMKGNEFCAVLDFFTNPNEIPMERMKKVIETNNNLIKMRKYAPEFGNRIAHIIQGFSEKEVERAFEPVLSGNEKLVMVGSYCPLLGKKGFKKLDVASKGVMVAKIIRKNRRVLENCNIHGLGSSGPFTMNINILAGMNHFDTSGAKLRAAGGKVIFPGTETLKGVPEAYLGNGKAKFGNTLWKEEYDEYLMMCECPVCSGLNSEERKALLTEKYPMRLIHNMWALEKEKELVEILSGNPANHLRYLLNIKFKNNGFYRNWAKKIVPSNVTREVELFYRQEKNELNSIQSNLDKFTEGK